MLLLLVAALSACSKSEVSPEAVFFKVFDDSNSDRSYYPVDMLELSDGGFYILAATTIDTTRTWLSTHIIRTDAMGEKLWETTLAKPYVNPIGMWAQGDKVMCFCLDDIGLGTHVLSVDDAGQTAHLEKSFPNIIYPLASAQLPDKGVLLVSYDRIQRLCRVTKFNSSMTQQWQASYGVIENAEEMLIKHMLRTGTQLPFFAGAIGNGNLVYAGGIYNYSLSTFVLKSTGEKSGIIYGFRYDCGINGLYAPNENAVFATRFNYNDQFVLPNLKLPTTGITNTSELYGNRLAEIAPQTKSFIFPLTVNGVASTVHVFTTNSNQVAVYVYNATMQITTKKLFGFANPVSIASAKASADGNIVLLMETKVFGRFRRIAVEKIPVATLK